MFIYNLFTLIIKLFSLAVFGGLVAVTAYLVWVGADFTLLVGELWFQYDVASLNLAEALISRYVYSVLWLDWIVPYVLQQIAYVVLPIGVLASGLFAYIALKL